MEHHHFLLRQRPYQLRHAVVVRLYGDVDAAADMATDEVGVADVYDGDVGWLVRCPVVFE